MPLTATQTTDVLEFWFGALDPEQWFKKDESVDAAIRGRFGSLYTDLSEDLPAAWPSSAGPCLAMVVVLDQFPRNIFRDDERAFESDAAALSLAKHTVQRRLDHTLPREKRLFIYLPFEHAEDMEEQSRAVELIEALGNAQWTAYAKQHQDIIQRFERFPHRNRILGRESTPEEIEYLLENPGF
jgi:uncharacterized protein (DUF924 family)